MPHSDLDGKAWAVEWLWSYGGSVRTVLDVGAGAGTWLDAVKPWFLHSRWTAVEVHEPYVDRFSLTDRYDEVVVGDARTVPFRPHDVVILGDILEHLPILEALELLAKARDAARVCVVASIPLGEYPQGEWQGNPHEAHLATWTDDDVHRLDPTVSRVGPVVGTYMWFTPGSRRRPTPAD